MEKKKKKWIIVFIVLLLLIFLSWMIFLKPASAPTNNYPNSESYSQSDQTAEKESEKSEKLTPEEALKSLEQDTSLGEDISLEIISPKEKSFMPSQARLWKAEFSGIDSDDSFRAECNWQFYLNENNEEVLYREQETSSSVSKDRPDSCGFTSTFINKAGKLRTVVNVEIKNGQDETLEEYQAEKEYVVQ